MTSFTLTYEQVLAVASLQHMASKDDVTPVITGINITVTPTELTASATDRYVVGVLTFPLDQKLVHDVPEEGSTILVHRSDMIQVARLRSDMTFSFVPSDDGRKSVSVQAQTPHDGRSLIFPTIYGTFPPVARLIDDDPTDDLPNGIGVNMGLIARVTKLLLPGEKSAATAVLSPWVLKYKAPTDPKKLAPIHAYRQNGSAQYRVLIQPTLRLR